RGRWWRYWESHCRGLPPIPNEFASFVQIQGDRDAMRGVWRKRTKLALHDIRVSRPRVLAVRGCIRDSECPVDRCSMRSLNYCRNRPAVGAIDGFFWIL